MHVSMRLSGPTTGNDLPLALQVENTVSKNVMISIFGLRLHARSNAMSVDAELLRYDLTWEREGLLHVQYIPRNSW
jgi:hypothetical protein